MLIMEQILSADLTLQLHALAVFELLNEYSHDDAGGLLLSERVKNDLVAELSKRRDAHIVLAFVAGVPAGMAICFEGTSSFLRKPLLQVRDLVVARPYRGRGLSQRILVKAEEVAAQAGCSKLTVEVQEGGISSLLYCGVQT
jgi:GNAT superfamily N-acetyltransferase